MADDPYELIRKLREKAKVPDNYFGTDEILREGDVISLRPPRLSWVSLLEVPKADFEFLQERPVIADDEGRFNL